jgi:hypothetical protein
MFIGISENSCLCGTYRDTQKKASLENGEHSRLWSVRKLPYLVDSSKLEFSAYRSMYSAGVRSASES